MKHYIVRVGSHVVYNGVGFIVANDIYNECKRNPKFKCTRCAAKEFAISSDKDIDSESILANIKKEQSCPDMNISCIGEINHEFIYQCDCCPQDIGEVTMVCEDK